MNAQPKITGENAGLTQDVFLMIKFIKSHSNSWYNQIVFLKGVDSWIGQLIVRSLNLCPHVIFKSRNTHSMIGAIFEPSQSKSYTFIFHLNLY